MCSSRVQNGRVTARKDREDTDTPRSECFRTKGQETKVSAEALGKCSPAHTDAWTWKCSGRAEVETFWEARLVLLEETSTWVALKREVNVDCLSEGGEEPLGAFNQGLLKVLSWGPGLETSALEVSSRLVSLYLGYSPHNKRSCSTASKSRTQLSHAWGSESFQESRLMPWALTVCGTVFSGFYAFAPSAQRTYVVLRWLFGFLSPKCRVLIMEKWGPPWVMN